MTMTKNPELVKLITELNKKYGAETVVLGSDITQHGGRITTGSLAVDVALGGGWPTNQWHEIIGEASHGKTAIALKTIAANQAKKSRVYNCMDCCRRMGTKLRRVLRC